MQRQSMITASAKLPARNASLNTSASAELSPAAAPACNSKMHSTSVAIPYGKPIPTALRTPTPLTFPPSFLIEMHEKRGNFCIFLLKLAEKEEKTDRPEDLLHDLGVSIHLWSSQC